ncbi:hypothetical protein [Candidatus Tisiphia endosymbiont of Neophilaenus lineatus]
MCIIPSPKRHRFPVSIISHAVWLYHRFNNSYTNCNNEHGVTKWVFN